MFCGSSAHVPHNPTSRTVRRTLGSHSGTEFAWKRGTLQCGECPMSRTNLFLPLLMTGQWWINEDDRRRLQMTHLLQSASLLRPMRVSTRTRTASINCMHWFFYDTTWYNTNRLVQHNKTKGFATTDIIAFFGAYYSIYKKRFQLYPRGFSLLYCSSHSHFSA